MGIRKFNINESNDSGITVKNDGIYSKYSMISGSYADIEKIDSDTWYIEYMESKKQRKGEGTEIINKIVLDAKEQGVKRIRLQTGEGTGYGFYKKLGFIEDSTNNNDRDNISMELLI